MKFATNPLPGMNPWFEAYWGDIYTSFTTYGLTQNQGIDIPARQR